MGLSILIKDYYIVSSATNKGKVIMLGGYTHAVGVTNCLIDALYLSLGGFDVQSTHVLPVLLQQGNKEIYCNVDVLNLQNTVRLCCTQGERKGEKM